MVEGVLESCRSKGYIGILNSHWFFGVSFWMYLGKNVLGGRLDNGDRSMSGASVTVENVRGHLLFIVVQLLSCVELFETP